MYIYQNLYTYIYIHIPLYIYIYTYICVCVLHFFLKNTKVDQKQKIWILGFSAHNPRKIPVYLTTEQLIQLPGASHQLKSNARGKMDWPWLT